MTYLTIPLRMKIHLTITMKETYKFRSFKEMSKNKMSLIRESERSMREIKIERI